MKSVISHIKSGFLSGLQSFLKIDLNPPKRKSFERIDTKEELRQTWEEVGGYIRLAMDTMDEDPEYQQAVKEHASYDAYQNYLNDEHQADKEHA